MWIFHASVRVDDHRDHHHALVFRFARSIGEFRINLIDHLWRRCACHGGVTWGAKATAFAGTSSVTLARSSAGAFAVSDASPFASSIRRWSNNSIEVAPNLQIEVGQLQ